MWLWRLAWIKLLLALFWNGSIDLPLLDAPHARRAPQAAPITHIEGILPEAAAQPVTNVGASPNAVSVLFNVWMGAVFIGAGRLGYNWRRSAQFRRNSLPLANDSLAELCSRLNIRRVPALRQSSGISVPILVGIRRPTVIVPTTAKARELRMMLAHELAHLKRRDLLWGWLPAICYTLFFFHPLLWLTRREWLLAQEMACDQLALRHSAESPAAYGTMLVDLLSVRPPEAGFGALGICEDTRNLKRRIHAMKIIGVRNSRLLMLALFVVGVTGVLPWRLVAQDKPDDAARRIQQLTRDNISLRQELEKLKNTANRNQTIQLRIDLLQDRMQREIAISRLNIASNQMKRAQTLVGAKVESPEVLDIARADVNRLEAEITMRTKTIAEREAALVELGADPRTEARQDTANGGALVEKRKAQERELYLEELKLAQNYADSMHKQLEAGRGTLGELVRAQRQVFGIQREIARLEGDRAGLKEAVQQEIKVVQRLLNEAKKQVELGIAAPGHDLDLQREMLRLKRELLQLEPP